MSWNKTSKKQKASDWKRDFPALLFFQKFHLCRRWIEALYTPKILQLLQTDRSPFSHCPRCISAAIQNKSGSALCRPLNCQKPGTARLQQLHHVRREEVRGNHHLRMHAHISASNPALTLGMSDHARRRCTGHAAAGRCLLLDRAALNAGPCRFFSTCSSPRVESFLSPATVLATAPTLGIAAGRDGHRKMVIWQEWCCCRDGCRRMLLEVEEWQQRESHSNFPRLSKTSLGITKGLCRCLHNCRNREQGWLTYISSSGLCISWMLFGLPNGHNLSAFSFFLLDQPKNAVSCILLLKD